MGKPISCETGEVVFLLQVLVSTEVWVLEEDICERAQKIMFGVGVVRIGIEITSLRFVVDKNLRQDQMEMSTDPGQRLLQKLGGNQC